MSRKKNVAGIQTQAWLVTQVTCAFLLVMTIKNIVKENIASEIEL